MGRIYKLERREALLKRPPFCPDGVPALDFCFSDKSYSAGGW